MANEPVVLNVYDMYWMNEYTSTLGIGIFHSGIQVYGRGRRLLWGRRIFWRTKWHRLWRSWGRSFGAMPITSLTRTVTTSQWLSRGVLGHHVQPVRPICAMASSPPACGILQEGCGTILPRESQSTHTCLTKVLCGREIPRWVNRLAHVSSCIPFLRNLLPREWLMPAALQSSLSQGHLFSEHLPASPAEEATPSLGRVQPPSLGVGRHGTEPRQTSVNTQTSTTTGTSGTASRSFRQTRV
uniref:deubiquitinase DESI2 isoform X1 n=1 Tax=Myxine glutinosa TaxID=7769 RepID=UPI00358DF408